jgi:hypothetical protein
MTDEERPTNASTPPGDTASVAAPPQPVFGRISFVAKELEREWDRKASIEQRAMALITVSGVLVTLIFGFSAAVAKGQTFANFTNYERGVLIAALISFIISAVLAVIANRPLVYGIVQLDELLTPDAPRDQPAPDISIPQSTFKALVERVDIARENNQAKANFLTAAIVAQLVAVLLLAVTIGFVVSQAGSAVTSTMTLRCQPNPDAVSAPAVCTATVMESDGIAPSGVVTFSSTAGVAGFLPSSCALVSGSCMVTYSPSHSRPRTETITAVYFGDVSHAGQTASVTLTAG